jgi:glycosyltransferase involved in cell wall biosynthesis
MLAGIAAEHRRAPFDVLHAFWVSPAGVVAAVAGQVLGVPVLLHLPGGDLTDLREIGYGARSHWQGRAWARLALAGATRITAPSDYIVRQARALGVRATRLPQGVALDRWPPRPPRPPLPRQPARRHHVGSLNPVKDQETLLRAALRLRELGVPFQLDVIGHDTLGGTIQRRAAELGLAGGVHFHGFLNHSELRPWMDRADLLLVTSRHEAGPLVLLEAAVAGVPTVGTAVGHLTEWAPDAAVAVPVGDHTALADAAAALLLDEERRLTLAAAAHARALREDADLTARATVEMYGEMRRAPREP